MPMPSKAVSGPAQRAIAGTNLRPAKRGSVRLVGLAAAFPLAATAVWLINSRLRVNHDMTLPPALPGQRHTLSGPLGTLSYYTDHPGLRTGAGGSDRGDMTRGGGVDDRGASAASAHPLLLIHSINAAGSPYEMRPIYEHYRSLRPVYALDLPGYGFSERGPREYTPQRMSAAIVQMLEHIDREHPGVPVDALALSLSSEFLARAAVGASRPLRSVGLISPTGFDRRVRNGPPGSHRGMAWLRSAFTQPLWSSAVFDLLTTRTSVRFFLEKTWGSKAIDEGLLEYDLLTSHQPGAQHVVFEFVSGFLFSNDIHAVYDALSCPVFMVYGIRGDFTDYRRTSRYEHLPHWRIHQMPTGALPHFEQPPAFLQHYGAFLAEVPHLTTALTPMATAQTQSAVAA